MLEFVEKEDHGHSYLVKIKRETTSLHYILIGSSKGTRLSDHHETNVSHNFVTQYRNWILERYSNALLNYDQQDDIDLALTIAKDLLAECQYPFDYTSYYNIWPNGRGEIKNFDSPIKMGNIEITRERVVDLIRKIEERKPEIDRRKQETKVKEQEMELLKQKWDKELRMAPLNPKDETQAVALQIERLKIEAERLHADNIQKQLLIKQQSLEVEKQGERVVNLSIEKLKLQEEIENKLLAIRKEAVEIKKQEKLIDADISGEAAKIENEQKLFNLRLEKEKELSEIHRIDYQEQGELRKLEIEKLRLSLEFEKIQQENKNQEIEKLKLQMTLSRERSKKGIFSWFKK